MKLLVANGYLIDPSQNLNAGKNLLIEDGRILGLHGSKRICARRCRGL